MTETRTPQRRASKRQSNQREASALATTPLSQRPRVVQFTPEPVTACVTTYSCEEYDRRPGDSDSYVCDRCRYAIDGDRFHCTACGDYDLCALCYDAVFSQTPHDKTAGGAAGASTDHHTCPHPKARYAAFGLGDFD